MTLYSNSGYHTQTYPQHLSLNEQPLLGCVCKSHVDLLFNSNSSSFTSNLCGFPNGVFIRNRLTRRDSSPLTRTFTSKRVSLGEKYVCVDGELRENHRQKLGLVC